MAFNNHGNFSFNPDNSFGNGPDNQQPQQQPEGSPIIDDDALFAQFCVDWEALEFNLYPAVGPVAPTTSIPENPLPGLSRIPQADNTDLVTVNPNVLTIGAGANTLSGWTTFSNVQPPPQQDPLLYVGHVAQRDVSGHLKSSFYPPFEEFYQYAPYSSTLANPPTALIAATEPVPALPPRQGSTTTDGRQHPATRASRRPKGARRPGRPRKPEHNVDAQGFVISVCNTPANPHQQALVSPGKRRHHKFQPIVDPKGRATTRPDYY